MNKDCIAMLLAGGQGSRLGVLTRQMAKPAVYYGGKYRIIDFTLSNCRNSNIDTVGVLTQYQPLELNTYIGSGQPWDLDRNNGGVFVLPPFMREKEGEWYKGTANAIYQNMSFISQFNPKYVLVLSGDHIYKMDYGKMLDFHKEKNAAVSIAVLEVPWEEADRFGIMSCDDTGRITDFAEKPKEPKSNMASMGIYIFNWQVLKYYLMEDEKDQSSSNDFGKDVIPKMLRGKERMYAYPFSGYWKDVGTIHSLWEAHMDLLESPQGFRLDDETWPFYSRNPVKPPHFISRHARISNSCITEGCNIYGNIEHSILFQGVYVFNNAIIRDSIIMPNARIGYGAVINKAIIGANSVIGDNSVIGCDDPEANDYYSDICSNGITLIGHNVFIDKGIRVRSNSMVERDITNQKLDINDLNLRRAAGGSPI